MSASFPPKDKMNQQLDKGEDVKVDSETLLTYWFANNIPMAGKEDVMRLHEEMYAVLMDKTEEMAYTKVRTVKPGWPQ